MMPGTPTAVVGDHLREWWEDRRHRLGGDGRSERFESARQRTIVVTFATPEDAQAWDDAGQPLDAIFNAVVSGTLGPS